MKRYVWPVASLLAAAGIQGNLPAGMSLMGARPDLVLVVLIAYSLAADPLAGAALGFAAGLVEGSAVGLSVGSFIVTRTLTGFLAGLATTRLFTDNPVVPVFSAAWLTAVCEGLFLIANPRAPLDQAGRIVLGECIYNAGFALLLYWLLRILETRRKIRLANARI
ncbi:MAG: rod shape-determining protein MreD [Armatimonadota bacterium]